MTTLGTPGDHNFEQVLFNWAPTPAAIDTAKLVTAMLDSGSGISDLIFSPGRPPQVEAHGDLVPVKVAELPMLKANDTARVAQDLIMGSQQVLRSLYESGSCDLSYVLKDRSRFRVNIFRQRGTYAIVMRVIAQKIPSLQDLNLPKSLEAWADLKTGIVPATAPAGAGQSTTPAPTLHLIAPARPADSLPTEEPN